jgi:hypothetical protein
MAIRSCKQCGGNVASSARACPHCGARQTSGCAMLFAIGAGILLVGFFISLATDDPVASEREYQERINRQRAADKAKSIQEAAGIVAESAILDLLPNKEGAKFERTSHQSFGPGQWLVKGTVFYSDSGGTVARDPFEVALQLYKADFDVHWTKFGSIETGAKPEWAPNP